MEFLDVVDQNDEVIGKASKEEVYEKKLTHRIVHVIVFNDKGEMALQLQSKYKSFCPQHWCTAAAGHVQSGESYEQAALRELEEETGIKKERKDIVFQYKDLYEYKSGLKEFLVTFKIVFSGPFKINSKEVEKVEFFGLDRIQEMVNKAEKFHPELLFLLERYFGIK